MLTVHPGVFKTFLYHIIFHVTPHLGTCLITATAKLYNLHRSSHRFQLGFYFLRLFHLDILLYRCLFGRARECNEEQEKS